MIEGEPTPLPTTIPGLFQSAYVLYARRFALYSIIGLIAFVVQFVVGVLLPHTDGLMTGLSIIVDAFIIAAVTIGVAQDIAGKPADWHRVVETASLRWGVVAVLGFFMYVLIRTLAPSVFGDSASTGYGLFVLPIITLWGAASLSTVVGSIEPAKTRLLLPFIALGRAMTVSLSGPNIGRLVLLSVVLTLQFLASSLLYGELNGRHVADAAFYANVPLDALITGPLQALSTVFFIDFLRRAKR